MFAVVFEVIWEDKDIIDICCTEDVEERAEYFINLGLKSSRGVGEAKGHNKGFKETIAGVECSHPFLAFFYLYLVERVNNVELSVELGCTKLRECFLEKGEGVTVLDSDSIQRSVVDAKL